MIKYLDCLKTVKLTTTGTVQRKLAREGCSKQGLAVIAVLLAQRFFFPFGLFYSQDHDAVTPFFPSLSKLSNIPLFASFQSHGLFFLLIIVICMHINTCNYIHTYILKYNLLNLDNLAGIYVFRAGGLGLNSQLACSSLGKIVSPTLGVP